MTNKHFGRVFDDVVYMDLLIRGELVIQGSELE